MFKTLKTIIAPKSFDLQDFLSKAKKYQKINSTFKKRIEEQIALQPSRYLRSGELAKATLCGNSILTLTDENLSKVLYILVNSKGFWEKIDDLSSAHLFKDLKFFIDEKQKKVLYVSYTSFQRFDQESFDCTFAKINSLKELISLTGFEFHLDYEKFFNSYIREFTSFLTSFFISIIPRTYEFDSTKLLKIASLLYESNPLEKMAQNGLSGIYVDDLGVCFQKHIPRSLRINILKLLSNNNSFDSYEAFFASYPNNVFDSYLNLTDNFVFDEKLLTGCLKKLDETDSLVTYTTSHRSTHYVIVKFKDLSVFSKCIKTLYANLHLFEYLAGVSNSDFTAYYLFFRYKHTKNLSETITKSDEKNLEVILRLVNSRALVLPFKPNTNMIDCFSLNGSSLYLVPTQLSSIDFEPKVPLDHHLFTMQIIKVFVEANGIDVADLYKYSFMKLLPYSFAMRLIDYLKTGLYDNQTSKSCVELLTSEHITRVKFLHEISNADSASFISEATSLPRVQELIRVRNLAVPVGCFNASSDCFSDSLILSDSTLSELFDYSNPDFQYITDVIVSEDFVKDGNYAILGVIWKYSNLRTIHSVINEGINSKQLYTMICSLATKKYAYLEALVSHSAISAFLVDQDFNVYINPKVLGARNNYKQVPIKALYRKNYYYTVVNAFSSLIQNINTWNAFDHFNFDELLDSFDMTAVSSLQFCKEHGHYHLPDNLCPECQKIYERVDRCDWFYHSTWPRGYYTPYRPELEYFVSKEPGITFTLATFNTHSEKLLGEVKIGLENNLYDGYFFRPLKIALDYEPFGILCNKIDLDSRKLLYLNSFQNAQRLKAVLLLYKNLLPKILSGKFITSDTQIFESIYLHKDHPGQIIIFNLPLMECSSVIQASKDEKILKTKQLFAEFLVNYITEDTSLNKFGEANIGHLVHDIRSLNFSEQVVMDCIETFCVVHNMPALPNRRICPICESNGISEENVQVLPEAYFKKLESSEATYEGGEANLYPDRNSKVTKLFKGNVDLILKSKIIGKALSISSRLEEFNKTHADIQFVTIDKVLYSLSSQGLKLRGYSLSFINDSFKISRLKDKEFAESKGYSRIDILNILKNVCIGIEFLHGLGVYIGDLNGGNILLKGKTVYFIDIDGMSFGDVKNFIYTDTYIYPPSATNQNITMDDDWYSLAIQAFYYLTYSHPFRGVCERDSVSSNVVERMTQGHSVLGEHGIAPPSISIGWDFMPSYLVAFFLQTFEGNRRENMRNVLEAFLAELTTPSTVNNGFVKSSRLSECKLAISETLYLSNTNSVIWNENVIISADNNPTFVKNCGNCFIFKTTSKTMVVNDKTGKVFRFAQMVNTDKCFATQNKLFYLSDNDTVLNVTSISESSGIRAAQKINRATTQKIVDLFVTESLKFIFLEEEDENHYAIYCNLQKLASVDISTFDKDHISSGILYDTLSGKYLVVLSGDGQTLTVTINTDGSYTTNTLPLEISQSKCYYGSTLYFVVNRQIQFCSLDYCKKGNIPLDFVTNNSLIYHQGNKFIVCSKNETYIRLKP